MKSFAFPVLLIALIFTPIFLFSQVLVADINQKFDSSSSSPNNFYEINDKMIFIAGSECFGTQLFATDGTAKGTRFLKEISSPVNQAILKYQTFKNNAYFKSGISNDSIIIWKTNGTTDGTLRFANLGESLVFDNPRLTTAKPGLLNNEMIFKVFSREPFGLHLVKLNLETTKAELIKTIDSTGGGVGSNEGFYELNGVLLFKTDAPTIGKELWITDGTTDGTHELKDIRQLDESSPHHISNIEFYNNNLLFIADDGLPGIWTTDGTNEHTLKITPEDHWVRDFFIENNKIYYTTLDNSIFVLNDQLENIKQVNFEPKENLLAVSWIKEVNNHMVVYCNTTNNGSDLWSYSLENNNWSFLNIYPGSSDANILTYNYLIEYDEKLFFRAKNDQYGVELWQSDGTLENTEIVNDINPGLNGSDPLYFFLWRDFIYFQAKSESGNELYKYSPLDLDNDGYLAPDDKDILDADINVSNTNNPKDVPDPCDFTSSINQIEKDINKVKLTPNPSNGITTINVTLDQNYSVYLYDIQGKLVFHESEIRDGYKLITESFNPGIYILKLFSKKGGISSIESLVIVDE